MRVHNFNYRTQPKPTSRLGLPENAVDRNRGVNHAVPRSKRVRSTNVDRRGPALPPETWYEPNGNSNGHYRIVVQSAGPGYRHAVTAEQVADRLSRLPDNMLSTLEVVQLSRMTRKKERFPCYGMQWGNTLYLYPIEEGLVEHYAKAPSMAVFNEARMFGGTWEQLPGGRWRLVWTAEAIRDFYLNNILIHELGHLLDHRNTRYTDRERYAEWFAIEHGYRSSQRPDLARRVMRRHHAS